MLFNLLSILIIFSCCCFVFVFWNDHILKSVSQDPHIILSQYGLLYPLEFLTPIVTAALPVNVCACVWSPCSWKEALGHSVSWESMRKTVWMGIRSRKGECQGDWNNLCVAKEKSHRMELKRQETFYPRPLQWGETDWSQCCWNEGQGSLKALSRATGKVLDGIGKRLVNVTKQSVFSNCHSLKLAPILPQKQSNTNISWWLHFREMAPKSLRKAIWGWKNW